MAAIIAYWLFTFALAFAVGVAVWFGRSVRDFFSPPSATVAVPSFAGQAESDALRGARAAKVRAVVVGRRPSDQYPKSVVMSQDPKPGTRVREGRQVSLIISTGVQIFSMPDLRYQSLREARLDLSRLHLQLAHTKTVPNDDIPADHVVSEDPPPLTSVREGSQVSLILSKGPPANVRVPDFVKMTIDQARAEAARRKVHLGQVVWTPFGKKGPPRGVVVRQLPAAGAEIDPYRTVSLQVSAGPKQTGYIVRQVHATVTIPALERVSRVRIEMRDETGTWNVYDSYAQPGQKLDFNLTAVGSAELNTYVNNELLNHVQIGKEPPKLKEPTKVKGTAAEPTP